MAHARRHTHTSTGTQQTFMFKKTYDAFIYMSVLTSLNLSNLWERERVCVVVVCGVGGCCSSVPQSMPALPSHCFSF